MGSRISRGESPEANDDGFIVTIDVNNEATSQSALVPRLRSMLLHSGTEDQDVILEPSDVVAFYLGPSTRLSFPSSTHAEPFVYPKYVHMDMFLSENFALSREKTREEQEMVSNLGKLSQSKKAITHFNVCRRFLFPFPR
jgi:hypothetical protein